MSGLTDGPSATQADIRWTLAIVLAAVAIASYGPLRSRFAARASAEQCAALLELRAEQLARAADPAPPATLIVERRARARSLPDAVDRCVREVTHEEAMCALASRNADEFERCVQ